MTARDSINIWPRGGEARLEPVHRGIELGTPLDRERGVKMTLQGVIPGK